MLKRTQLRSKRERDEELLTITEVAQIAKLSTQTVRRHIKDGVLPALRLGKKMIRVRRGDLQHVLRRF